MTERTSDMNGYGVAMEESKRFQNDGLIFIRSRSSFERRLHRIEWRLIQNNEDGLKYFLRGKPQ